uniref:RING-type E3 ubiquitin transferase n=3 Tax=Cucumis melo TaxID=3656 RepID=A0A9I9D2F9_CUCME
MIPRSKDFRRRIMSSPAIRPCECTAPGTLLTSLINLSRTICSYRHKFFGSNKQNAIKLIRQIGILLAFFEDLQDRNSDEFSDSIVLVISELHLIFQKILYLLEDCALEGARLFMLMKSEHIANRFRVLIRSVALALEILPLNSMDVSVDVVDYVELVIKQARREKFGNDGEDEEIVNEVKSILSLFDNRIVPDNSRIKRVLDYIGVKSWSLCNKEVKFLDSEIEFEWSNQDKTEVSFLSNSMGLMNYCRCMLFDVVDSEADRQVDECRIETMDCLNPDDFRCPISLEFMFDPVTLVTGQTYERSSIQKWFRAGNLTCPNTGERLKNRELVPNLALRRIIRQYCSKNSIPFPESSKQKPDLTRTIAPGSPIVRNIIMFLANFLADFLESGTLEEKNRAAFEIKFLSKASLFYRCCLVEIDLIPNLLKLLRSKDNLTQKNAIAAVLNLSKHSKSKKVIAENSGLEAIVHVLMTGYKVESRQFAAGTLFYMASIEKYRKLIAEIPNTLPGLLNLLKDNADRSKKNAMVAIYGLLMHSGNHRKVLSSGAVPLLVNLIETCESEILISDSMEILATLAGKPEGTAAILRSGALNSIMEFLNSCSSITGREYSVSLLVALCLNGGSEVIGVIAKNQTVISSVYSVVSEGTSRGKKKANSLMRVLHEFTELESSNSDSSHLLQDRIVQAW